MRGEGERRNVMKKVSVVCLNNIVLDRQQQKLLYTNTLSYRRGRLVEENWSSIIDVLYQIFFKV